MHTVKRHESGRRKSVKNPLGPNFLDRPHLAHVSAAEFDEVNALLEAANGGLCRKPVGGNDPRANVPKKRTTFPGQHAACGASGRPYNWGGHGRKGHMMCSGTRDYKCWNTVALHQKLTALQARDRDRDLTARLGRLAQEPAADVVFPAMADLWRRAADAVAGATPADLGRVMRQLVPRLRIVPVRLCDGGGLDVRADLTVDLTSLAPAEGLGEGEAAVLRSELTVDLFDPPQGASVREQVLRLRGEGLSERQAAQKASVTVTAAQRAKALDRVMKACGLTDPYVVVTEPPADLTKMKRHLHPRYRFDPLPPDA